MATGKRGWQTAGLRASLRLLPRGHAVLDEHVLSSALPLWWPSDSVQPVRVRRLCVVAFLLCSWKPGVMTNLDSHLEGDKKPCVGNGEWQARSLRLHGRGADTGPWSTRLQALASL